jgi:hypothetical protein
MLLFCISCTGLFQNCFLALGSNVGWGRMRAISSNSDDSAVSRTRGRPSPASPLPMHRAGSTALTGRGS